MTVCSIVTHDDDYTFTSIDVMILTLKERHQQMAGKLITCLLHT